MYLHLPDEIEANASFVQQWNNRVEVGLMSTDKFLMTDTVLSKIQYRVLSVPSLQLAMRAVT